MGASVPGLAISRILSLENHLSGTPVTGRLAQSTRYFLRDEPPQCICLTLLPVWFAWLPTLLPTPVVSYTPVSPSRLFTAISSLLHLSSGCPAWRLASTAPCGVRTFLNVPVARRDSLLNPAQRIIADHNRQENPIQA